MVKDWHEPPPRLVRGERLDIAEATIEIHHGGESFRLPCSVIIRAADKIRGQYAESKYPPKPEGPPNTLLDGSVIK